MMDIRALLLELITQRQKVTQEQLDSLSEEQWLILLTLAASQRIAPLLHHRLQERTLHAPEKIAAKLKKWYQKSALRSLQVQAELVKLHKLFAAAGIHFIALKGSYLATSVYPSTALRPMRDIDLLLPEKEIRAGYQLLLAAGYAHPPEYIGDPEAILKQGKHLPPLLSPSRIMVELHNKVLHPEDWPGEDFTADPNFWQRCVTTDIAGKHFQVMSDTDLLLHLIIHAAFDHKFNNGPLLFPDIAFLLRNKPIDWDFFWKKTEKGGGKDGCALVLHMIKYYYSDLKVEGLPAVDSKRQPLAENAVRFSLLTLHDNHLRTDQACLSLIVHNSFADKIKVLFKQAFPSKAKLSTKYPISANSPLVYLYYPVKWLHLLQRLPTLLSTYRRHEQRHQSKELAVFTQWLKARK